VWYKNAGLAIVTAIVAIAAGWVLLVGVQAGVHTAIPDHSAEERLAACQALRQNFDDYPILFLGDEFDGQKLQTCDHQVSASSDSRQPSSDRFDFVYGTCDASKGSCPVPLQISLDWSCGPTPIWAGSVPTVRTRGLTLHVGDAGHLWANGAGFHLSVFVNFVDSSQLTDEALNAVDALYGANRVAERITPSDRLNDRSLLNGTPPCL